MSAAWSGNATGDAVRMQSQTFAIMGRSIHHFELRNGGIVLWPLWAGDAAVDIARCSRSIRSGTEAMLAQLPDLRTRVLTKTR